MVGSKISTLLKYFRKKVMTTGTFLRSTPFFGLRTLVPKISTHETRIY